MAPWRIPCKKNQRQTSGEKRQACGQIPKPPHENRLGMSKSLELSFGGSQANMLPTKHGLTRHEILFVEYYFAPWYLTLNMATLHFLQLLRA